MILLTVLFTLAGELRNSLVKYFEFLILVFVDIIYSIELFN